ncbi:MAG: hypothetical protein FJ316_04520 [SAR202 cluster bacterium]|nr:hypothetical protein [SAR202 cluster bacterium]
MDSSIIGKIDKARKYAEEKERVTITSFKASFQGNHNTYQVSFDSGVWHCQCLFFTTRGVCGHTMALQRMLDEVLAHAAKDAVAAN